MIKAVDTRVPPLSNRGNDMGSDDVARSTQDVAPFCHVLAPLE